MTEATADSGTTSKVGSDGMPEDDLTMSVYDHLGELRIRLVRILVAMVPTTAVSWLFHEQLLEAMVRPLVLAWGRLGLGKASLHFANPVDPFLAYLKVSLVAGLLLAAPWVFWQIWAFVAPGLYRREKRMALPFVFFATLFFVGGTAFGYFVVFPLAFETLLGFGGALPSGSLDVRPTLMISEYLGFVLRLLLAFGLVFEVPVFVFFLSLARIVSARALLRFGRWWALAATFIAAFLTPPDVGSQLMMLVPLVVLYYLSVLLAFAMERFRSR